MSPRRSQSRVQSVNFFDDSISRPVNRFPREGGLDGSCGEIYYDCIIRSIDRGYNTRIELRERKVKGNRDRGGRGLVVIAVGETRNARAFDYRCLHESAGGRVVRSDARVSMEERERRGRKEIERRPPTYRRVHAVDEYTTVLRSLGFISALKMPSLSRSRPFPSPRSEHRCSFAKPTRGPPLRLWLNGLPICQDPTPIPCVFSLVPPLLFRSRHPFLPVPCFARSLSLRFTGPSSLSLLPLRTPLARSFTPTYPIAPRTVHRGGCR